MLSCKRTVLLRPSERVGSGDCMVRCTACGQQAVTSGFLAGIRTKHMGFKRGKLERCLFVHASNEARVVSHVDDPLICAKPATLEKFWMLITKLVVIKRREALNPRILVYLGSEYQSVHEAKRKGFTVKPTDKNVNECLDIAQLRNAKSVMTPLTELKSTNLHYEKRCVIKLNTHCSELWLGNCSTYLE